MQFRLPAVELRLCGPLLARHRIDLRNLCEGLPSLRAHGWDWTHTFSLFREGKRARMSFSSSLRSIFH